MRAWGIALRSNDDDTATLYVASAQGKTVCPYTGSTPESVK